MRSGLESESAPAASAMMGASSVTGLRHLPAILARVTWMPRPGGAKLHELRLAQPVDRWNDQADPRCRNLNAVRAGSLHRDRVHDFSLRCGRASLAGTAGNGGPESVIVARAKFRRARPART